MERTDCAICDKNFDSSDTLRRHIRTVHECDPDDIFGVEPHPSKRAKKDIESEEVVPVALNTSAGSLISSQTDGNGVVVREFLVDEGDGAAQTITLENETYTILPLDGAIEGEQLTDEAGVKPEAKKEEAQVSPVVKKEQRKSLAASLAAAIADNLEESCSEDDFSGEILTEEDIKLKENVGKLIDMLVDPPILKKYGWPNAPEETVLCKVIENCGHDLTKGGENYAELDYGSRMREYCKLLFTVVIHNDSIKSLLNNFPIDDVIEYVLGDEDQDEGGLDKDNESHSGDEEAVSVTGETKTNEIREKPEKKEVSAKSEKKEIVGKAVDKDNSEEVVRENKKKPVGEQEKAWFSSPWCMRTITAQKPYSRNWSLMIFTTFVFLRSLVLVQTPSDLKRETYRLLLEYSDILRIDKLPKNKQTNILHIKDILILLYRFYIFLNWMMLPSNICMAIFIVLLLIIKYTNSIFSIKLSWIFNNAY